MDWKKPEQEKLEQVEFKGEKRFLSNFYPAPILMDRSSLFKEIFPEFPFDHEVYPTSEHLYQALKSEDPAWHAYIRGINDTMAAKRAANKSRNSLFFKLRYGWVENGLSLRAMHLVLLLKFTQHPNLLRRLVAIKGHIEERNYWNDTFWGTCNGVGENHLGKLLMRVRDELPDLLGLDESYFKE